MAEGGEDPAQFNMEDLIHLWPEDYRDEEEEANITRPFQPGQASTPYHGGEQVEMQTMQHEKSGLPSYEETSFGGEKTPVITTDDEITQRLANLRRNSDTGVLDISEIPNAKVNPLSEEDQREQIELTKRLISYRYPKVNFAKLGVIRYSLKNPMEIVVVGPKGGETVIFLKDGSDLQEKFLNKTFVKNALGPSADKIKTNISKEIRERQKILAERRQEQARFFEEKAAKEKEELDLKRRITLEEEKKTA